jgi:hypothetical protein
LAYATVSKAVLIVGSTPTRATNHLCVES